MLKSDPVQAAAEAAGIASTPARQLAQQAAKKGVVEKKGNFHRATRLTQDLKPADPKMTTFNLNNFKKTTTKPQLKFMLQEFFKLASAQFEKMELLQKEKAEMVAFLLKSFQKDTIFASVDSAVFYNEENQVWNLL